MNDILYRAVRKRRSLGQHYLVDQSVIDTIIAVAVISPRERVLEIGTGKGMLTRRLAGLSTHLEAFELDRENFRATMSLGVRDLKLHLGDGFSARREFDVLVSSLPYSESSNFVEWLSQCEYDRAVVVLQKDFVEKLLSAPGEPAYRAVSVISQISSVVHIVRDVHRESFSPPPKVLSVVAEVRPRTTLTKNQIRFLRLLFSQRRKKLSAALKRLDLKVKGMGTDLSERRVEGLSASELETLLLLIGEPVNLI